MIKLWFQSKTVWLNLIPFIISINDLVIHKIGGLGLSNTALIVAILSGINIVLRFLTSKPVAIR